MKKKHLIILIVSALILTMAFIANIYGEDAEPGSEGNPLVTKNYVDNLITGIKDRLAKLEANGGASTGAPAAAAGWEVIHVEGGQSVVAGQGTEIVVRSGKAVAVDNGHDGVSDLTAGKDLLGGTAIEWNHLLLVPRDDGRGIKCNSACWVMILGEYEVK